MQSNIQKIFQDLSEQTAGGTADHGMACMTEGSRGFPLPGWAEGENRLLLICRYRNSMELENCYLCGEFGVNTERKITEQPTALLIGDWTGSGIVPLCRQRQISV